MPNAVFICHCFPALVEVKIAHTFMWQFQNVEETSQRVRERNRLFVCCRVLHENKAKGYQCMEECKVYKDAGMAQKLFDK